MTPFTRNIGILIAFIVGASVDYKYVPCIYIIFPIIFGIAFILFPNSPQYHLKRAQFQVSLTHNFDLVNCSSQLRIIFNKKKRFISVNKMTMLITIIAMSNCAKVMNTSLLYSPKDLPYNFLEKLWIRNRFRKC